ncbi:MAG: phosphotransferase [Anaerolineae bacterium]|nr:phosphotransferase [Anaerolineae bacterium]
MDTITLEEIIEFARNESGRMQHFYIGVEHLFIALTKLDGGITTLVLEGIDSSAQYLRYATRELSGRGDERRYWSGYRTTPRANQVLDRARTLIGMGIKPSERALFIAIIEEADNIPFRAMKEAGVDIPKLLDQLQHWQGVTQASAPVARIIGGEALAEDRVIILRQMFRKYDSVRIEHMFTEGFSGATVLLVRPVHGDGRADAAIVVKVDDRQQISWEKKRYDSFVKDTLPPRTARVEGEPVLPDRLPVGGIRYTFLRARDEEAPTDLHDYFKSHTPEQIASFLRKGLYDSFRENWWGQRKPYTFAAWAEYELVLPPALVVEVTNEPTSPATGMVVRPLGDWSHTEPLKVGDSVELDGFTALKTKREKGIVQVLSGAESAAINWAGRIDLYGLDLSQKVYFRGELMRKLTGKVRSTRGTLLLEHAAALQPDFSLADDLLPRLSTFPDRLPNPIRNYLPLLDRKITGTLSTIHGDLHAGNILIGSGNDAWLIDFEWTRDGHTLFDWAVLETSLLIDYVSQHISESWDDARSVTALLDGLNREGVIRTSSELALHLLPIVEVRGIVKELLFSDPISGRSQWAEYYVALALCTLRVIGWSNRPLAARRLAFLASALAMAYTQTPDQSRSMFTSADLTTDQGMLGGSLIT